MSNNPEVFKSQEANVENAPNKQFEISVEKQGSQVELSPRDIEAQSDKIRQAAMETAISIESKGAEKSNNTTQDRSMTKRGPVSKKLREKSYAHTMKQIQNELPLQEKVFSKIIHNKVVEKTSDVIGDTIARPNILLAGAFSSFFLTLVLYIIARTIGFRLSGSETIIAFIIGWCIGAMFEYFRVLFTNSNRR